jgi:hypothetical protein
MCISLSLLTRYRRLIPPVPEIEEKSAEWVVALKEMDCRPSQGFYFFSQCCEKATLPDVSR